MKIDGTIYSTNGIKFSSGIYIFHFNTILKLSSKNKLKVKKEKRGEKKKEKNERKGEKREKSQGEELRQNLILIRGK